MKRISIALATALWAGLALCQPTANAAQPVLKRNWEITFCNNPDKQCIAKVCVQFTRVPDQVDSMPLSGTWTMTGWPLNGRWVQYGDVVQFFGKYTSIPAFISFTGILNGDTIMGFISFVDSTDSQSGQNTGTWRGRRTNACAAPAPSQSKLLASDPD